jgi:hypothetical protein
MEGSDYYQRKSARFQAPVSGKTIAGPSKKNDRADAGMVDYQKEVRRRQSLMVRRSLLQQSNKVFSPSERKDVSSLQLIKAGPVVFTEFTFSDHGYHIILIGLALVADFLTLIPLVGMAIGFFFAVFFWVIYAIQGHFKRNGEKKFIARFIASFLEVNPLTSFLPGFTGSAILALWMDLAQNKASREAR